jgi:hypothetical protein
MDDRDAEEGRLLRLGVEQVRAAVAGMSGGGAP